MNLSESTQDKEGGGAGPPLEVWRCRLSNKQIKYQLAKIRAVTNFVRFISSANFGTAIKDFCGVRWPCAGPQEKNNYLSIYLSKIDLENSKKYIYLCSGLGVEPPKARLSLFEMLGEPVNIGLN